MAITTYEIITYGGGEAVFNVLKGVSAIVGDTSYTSLQRLTLLVGFLWVIGGAAFNFRVIGSFTWLLGALLVIYIALIPKVSVTVIDKVDPKAGLVVQKAPLGLGVTAAAISQIGLYVTEAFERVYSLPSDQNYSENGMLFGMRLIQGASQAKLLDANTLQDFREFFDTCVLYDTAFGLYSWHDLQHSENLFDFFDGKTSKLRRFYINGQFETCQDGFSDLKSRLGTAIQEAEKEGLKSFFRSNQAQSGEAAARAEIAAMMQSSYNYLADLSSSSAELMRQNIMINTVRDAARGLDPVTSYAVSRAEAERVETWKAMGELSLRTLPLLKTVIEIILLAIFPIVILAALIAPKQVVTTYVKALIWLQLWAPLYAILHMILMTYTADAQGNQLDALTLANQGQLASSMAEMGYIAGYLAMSIPMIAYMLINQGGMMMANLAGGLMQGMQGIAQRGAEEATTGNISFGNVQQDNVNMFKNDRNVTDQSGVLTLQGADGNILSMSAQGTSMTNNPITASVNGALTASTQTNLTDSVNAAKQNLSQYSESLGQTHSRLEGISNVVGNAENQGHTFDKDTRASWEQSYNKSMDLADQFAKHFKVSKEEAITMATSFNAGVTATAGGKIPIFGGLEASTDFRAALKADGKGAATEMSDEQRSWIEKSGFADALKKAESSGEKLAMSYTASEEDTATKQLQAQLQQHSQLQESTSSSLAEARAWQKTMANIEQKGATYGVDGAAAVRNQMIDTYGAAETDKLLAQARNGDFKAQTAVNWAAADWAHGMSKRLMHDNLSSDEVYSKNKEDSSSLPNQQNITTAYNTDAANLNENNKITSTPRVDSNNELVQEVRNTTSSTDAALEQRVNQTAATGEYHKQQVNTDTDTTSVGLVGKAFQGHSITGAGLDIGGRAGQAVGQTIDKVADKFGVDTSDTTEGLRNNPLIKNTPGTNAENMRKGGK